MNSKVNLLLFFLKFQYVICNGLSYESTDLDGLIYCVEDHL